MDGEMNMSHGDGDTIPEDLGEDYFPPNFKEYMLKEQLKWWRYQVNFPWIDAGWVFWSQHDHKITRALQKWISDPFYGDCCLVQFWAATKTLEGRTRLTTQFRPFALSPSYTTSQRQLVCEYRMKMCSSEYNNCFYTDAQSGEEQLGLPGRVFLHQFPESTTDVKYYSTKEYPQRDLALRCKIRASWVVPVFEHSSRTCVGVLEMASLREGYDDWPPKFYINNVNKIFQDYGLRCFNGNQDCMLCGEDEFWKKVVREEGLPHAYRELRTVLRSVCETHELPLAMTSVPCCACNGLRQRLVEFCSHGSGSHDRFLKASKLSYLRKGLVFRRALSSLNMLYCSNISKLSLDEYPLVPYARHCKFSGWFTICLQNVYTGNDIYVLEFFLPARSEDSENILPPLNFILGTMENNFKTFRLASGKELGEEMSFEVIHFQNNQRFQSVRRIQATREFSISSSSSSGQSSTSVANTRPGFQDANMGTINAEYDLNSNPFYNFDLPFDFDFDPSFEQSSPSVANTRHPFYNFDLPFDFDFDPFFEQSSPSVANTRPGFQNANVVIIIAEYASMEEVFQLSLPCRLVELQQEVTRRLMLEVGAYSAIYEDEEDGPVLIACDEDLQTCVDDSMSQGNTPRVVLLEQKEPATNLNPTN